MKDSLSCSKLNINIGPDASSHHEFRHEDENTFSINCLLRTVRVEKLDCLLSRTNYCFPSALPVSVAIAMQHANCLNQLVSHSMVHVVKDIDGDRGYFLQIDSVLKGDRTPAALSTFLGNIEKDIEVILKYFQKETQRETSSKQATSLASVSQGCNIANLRTSVCLVA